jgi:transcriptional regulator with XRE-family HTH domain
MEKTSKLFSIAFGRHLKQLRESRQLTQEELAFKSGTHRTYISLVERGERNITLDTLYRLSKALNVSAATLFLWDETTKDEK